MDAFYVIFAVMFFSPNTYGEIIHHRAESIFPQYYDIDEPPTKEGKPAAVYVSLSILDVDSIDEAKMFENKPKLSTWRRLYIDSEKFQSKRLSSWQVRRKQPLNMELWKDERLNLSCYLNDLKEPRIFSSKLVKHIWKPDLFFDIAKDGQLFHLTLPNTVIKVMQDGSFKKESRYNLIVSCPMNLQFYPMDTQNCVFDIASLSFTDTQLMLHWTDEHPIYAPVQGILLPYKIAPLKYKMTDVVQSKFVEIGREGNFTVLRSEFVFVRRLTGVIFKVYIPSTLVVLLSWISFWVDVEDVSSRITLGVTLLLTLSTQIVQAHSGLPPISYLTAMDIWLFGCLIGVFSVLVEFAFAYRFRTFHKIQSCDNSLPIDDEETTHQKSETQSNDNGTDNGRVRNHFNFSGILNLDKHSRKAFPLLFIFFSIMYWIYFLCNK